MNTPEPCNKCIRCKWDCVLEDDPDDGAWCALGLTMGNPSCGSFYLTNQKRGER